MRKVVLYQLLSLDGVAEEPGDWLFDAGEDLVDNLGRVIGAQDLILLGRNTYDYWVDYWPTSEFQPFASFINQTPKHVFTSGTPSQVWPGSTFIASPADDYVADLKRLPGADIGIHGSITLAQTLLRANLVDEMRLVVSPTLAGRGKRLFTNDDDLRRFELLDVDRTAGGTILIGYRATG